jgi:hypothetical protein
MADLEEEAASAALRAAQERPAKATTEVVLALTVFRQAAAAPAVLVLSEPLDLEWQAPLLDLP